MATTSQARARAILANRDVSVLFVVFLALVVLTFITTVRALQIPGYILFVGFDAFQNTYLPNISSVAFYLGLGVYLYLLAFVLGSIYRSLRD